MFHGVYTVEALGVNWAGQMTKVKVHPETNTAVMGPTRAAESKQGIEGEDIAAAVEGGSPSPMAVEEYGSSLPKMAVEEHGNSLPKMVVEEHESS